MFTITPTDSSDTQLANKCFWSLFKHSRTNSMSIAPLKDKVETVSDPIAKASLLNNTFHSAFSKAPCSSDLPRATCSPYPSVCKHLHYICRDQECSKGSNLTRLLVWMKFSPRRSKNWHLPSHLYSMLFSQVDHSPHTQSRMTEKWQWSLLSSKRVTRTVLPTIVNKWNTLSLPAWCPTLMSITFYTMQPQHGFCQGHSRETQLLELITTNLLSNLASGNQTDLIIMDVSKAFDKVVTSKFAVLNWVSVESHVWYLKKLCSGKYLQQTLSDVVQFTHCSSFL